MRWEAGLTWGECYNFDSYLSLKWYDIGAQGCSLLQCNNENTLSARSLAEGGLRERIRKEFENLIMVH